MHNKLEYVNLMAIVENSSILCSPPGYRLCVAGESNVLYSTFSSVALDLLCVLAI